MIIAVYILSYCNEFDSAIIVCGSVTTNYFDSHVGEIVILKYKIKYTTTH